MNNLLGRWTSFQIDAETDAFGVSRIVKAHNELCDKVEHLEAQLGLYSTYEKAHSDLVDIQDWITESCDEYKDGELTDAEIIKSIYTRLHENIDLVCNARAALEAVIAYTQGEIETWSEVENLIRAALAAMETP